MTIVLSILLFVGSVYFFYIVYIEDFVSENRGDEQCRNCRHKYHRPGSGRPYCRKSGLPVSNLGTCDRFVLKRK